MNIKLSLTLFLLISLYSFQTNAQVKQVYKDVDETNELRKISFYSTSEGYVAFKNWIGYTNDGGATYTKKHISLTNVNYNGHSANLTFGFAISGVKAFDKNTIIVYGDYGLVPSILYSTDQGNTFKLIFHSQPSETTFSYVIDMIFPENENVGFAIDETRIFKTINKGLTWTLVNTSDGYFKQLEAADNSSILAISSSKILRSTNAGASWSQLKLPPTYAGKIGSAHCLSANKIWLNFLNDSQGYMYYSSNAGNTWTLKNNPNYNSANFEKIKFFDDNVGYAIGDSYDIFKTIDGGKYWEPLPRENNMRYLDYSHLDIQFWDINKFWAGGYYGILESTENGGGTPVPQASFGIDISTLAANNTVKLNNYSKPDYNFEWYRNDILISNAYNATYTRDIFKLNDKIRLVVLKPGQSSYTEKEITLPEGVYISKFNPVQAGINSTVTITGLNFTGATKVTFGGVDAASFTVVSATTITAKIAAGASGDVVVTTPNGTSSLSGFIYLPPPIISSFTPATAASGSIISINGTNFVNVANVTFGGAPASSFQVVSSTLITAVVGSGESGNIAVTTNGGSATLTGFNILPTINSFTPTSGTNGGVITITGTGFTTATGVSIGNVPVKSFKVTSSSSITAIVGAASSGAVVVTNKNGNHTMAGFTFYDPPKITSIAPNSGPAGSLVTLRGLNFSPNSSANIVRFGDVIAKVSSASATTLTVEIPAATNHKPITVTTNGLIASYSTPFIVTFPNGNSINSKSFENKVTVALDGKPSKLLTADFDDDGALDLITYNIRGNGLANEAAIYRNKNVSGDIQFEPKISVANSVYEATIHTADFDGDGKLDILFRPVYGGIFSIYRNISTVGKISFDAKVDFTSNSQEVSIADLNLDGKVDLLIAYSIYKNISSPGIIAFDTPISAKHTDILHLKDLDGDGYPDYISPKGGNSSYVTIFKNSSTLDNFVFSEALQLNTEKFTSITSADINGDQKPDIVAVNNETNRFTIFQNLGNRTFSFGQPLIYNGIHFPIGIAFNDLDGDGMIDIGINSSRNSVISVFKNLSNADTIVIGPNVDFIAATAPKILAMADLDGDGKGDIITSDESTSSITILRNTVKKEPFITSFNPSIGEKNTSVIITGLNFDHVTAVTFGEQPAASFIINSNTQITALVGNGSSGHVTVTDPTGASSLKGFSFGFAPVITSVAPLKANAGTSITITGNYFGSNINDIDVHFGLVKGIVTAAAKNVLTVTVPNHTTYSPITVTVNGLTGYSQNAFVLTFSGNQLGFTDGSFSPAVNYHPGNESGNAGDFDGDGRIDLVYFREWLLSAYRNTTLNHEITFAAPLNFPIGQHPKTIESGDLNGDGKLDLILLDLGERISLFRNTGTIGTIDFAPIIDLFTGTLMTNVKIHDLDGDGKPEIVVSSNSGKVFFYQNLSSLNHLSFSSRIDIPTVGGVSDLTITDINHDGKPDIAAVITNSNQFVVFRNNSIGTKISFAPFITFSLPEPAKLINSGDLDGDELPDIVVSSKKLMVFRNISIGNSINFASRLDLPEEYYPINAITIADLDGDGKPEVTESKGNFSVFKNTSVTGSLSFAEKKAYPLFYDSRNDVLADIDGDGKPDIVSIAGGIGTSILGSFITTRPVITYIFPTEAADGAKIKLTGFNFNNVTGVNFGGVPVASFTIISSTIIEVVLGEGASGPITVTTATGSYNYLIFEYIAPPVITSFTPKAAAAGETVTIKGKHFTGATKVEFANNAKSFKVLDNNTVSGVVAEGSHSGDVTVVTPYGVGTLSGFLYANTPYLTIDDERPPYVGNKRTLSVDTDASFIYQWTKNGIDIPGATASSITISEGGSYTASLIHNGKRLTSKNMVISYLSILSPTNFKIKATNKTCKSSTNGGISITAVENLKYTATITGPVYNQSSKFTKELNIEALAAGKYSICITLDDYPTYKQCFEVIITEPKDLSLFSSVINSDQTITLVMDGADSYHIQLNDKSYTTTSNQITLPLLGGGNLLKISSGLICQGTLEKLIELPTALKIYPNPFDDTLNIQLGMHVNQANVNVEIYDLSGKKQYSQTLKNDNGNIAIELGRLNSGIYLLKVFIGAEIIQSKIVKK